MMQSRRRDPQRQRQIAAQGEDLRHGVNLASHSVAAGDPFEEARRVGLGERVETERLRPGQPDEPLATRDQNEGVAGGRKQRLELLDGHRVVENDERPPAVQLGSPQRHPFVQPGRHFGRGDAETAQQCVECLLGGEHAAVGGVAAQVDEQVRVGVLVDEPVRGVQRQRGLADAGQPVDRDDRRDAGCRVGRIGEQRSQLVGSPGEIPCGGWQIGWRWLSLVSQQFQVEFPQLRAWLSSQIVGDLRSGPGEVRECLGSTPATAKGPDEPCRDRLRQGMSLERRGQVRDQLGAPPESLQRVGVLGESAQPFHTERFALPGKPIPGDVGERVVAPQAQRLAGEPHVRLVGAGLPRAVEQDPEAVQVDELGIDVENIASAATDQQGLAVRRGDAFEHAPEPGDVAVERVAYGGRGRRAPDPVDQGRRGHHAPRVEQQDRKQCSLPLRAEVDRTPPRQELNRAKHPKEHEMRTAHPQRLFKVFVKAGIQQGGACSERLVLWTPRPPTRPSNGRRS